MQWLPHAASLPRRGGRSDRGGRAIGIKVRFDDFSTLTRARTVAAPTDAFAAVHATALELLRALDLARPVRLLGVRVAGMDERRDAKGGAAAPGQLALSL